MEEDRNLDIKFPFNAPDTFNCNVTLGYVRSFRKWKLP